MKKAITLFALLSGLILMVLTSCEEQSNTPQPSVTETTSKKVQTPQKYANGVSFDKNCDCEGEVIEANMFATRIPDAGWTSSCFEVMRIDYVGSLENGDAIFQSFKGILNSRMSGLDWYEGNQFIVKAGEQYQNQMRNVIVRVVGVNRYKQTDGLYKNLAEVVIM